MNLKEYMTQVSGSTACTLNLLALPFIYFKSSSHIGHYKYLLLLYTMTAVQFTLSQAILKPTFMVSPNGYMFHSYNPHLNRFFGTCLILTLIAAYCQTIFILAVSFIYRFGVMYSRAIVDFIVNKKIYLFILMCCCVSYLVFTVAHGMFPNKKYDDIFREDVYKATGMEITLLCYIGGPIWEGHHIIFDTALVLVSFATYTASGVAVNIFCTTKILNEFRKLTNIASSSVANSYHRKLFMLLAFQTIFPVIFNLCPPFTAFILGLTNTDIGEGVAYFGAMLTFSQVIDPILLFILIADYRRAVMDMFKSCFPSMTTVETVSSWATTTKPDITTTVTASIHC